MKLEFVHQRQVIYTVESIAAVPYTAEIVNMGEKGKGQELYLVSNRIWNPLQNRVEIMLMKMGEG